MRQILKILTQIYLTWPN